MSGARNEAIGMDPPDKRGIITRSETHPTSSRQTPERSEWCRLQTHPHPLLLTFTDLWSSYRRQIVGSIENVGDSPDVLRRAGDASVLILTSLADGRARIPSGEPQIVLESACRCSTSARLVRIRTERHRPEAAHLVIPNVSRSTIVSYYDDHRSVNVIEGMSGASARAPTPERSRRLPRTRTEWFRFVLASIRKDHPMASLRAPDMKFGSPRNIPEALPMDSRVDLT